MLQKNQWKIWTWRRKPSVWRMVWRWCGKGVKPSLSVCQSGDEARNPPTPLYYTNIHRTNWQRAILKILRFFWKTFTRQGWYNQPHQTNLPWTINCEQEPRANLVMTQEMLTPLHYTNHYTITPPLHYTITPLHRYSITTTITSLHHHSIKPAITSLHHQSSTTTITLLHHHSIAPSPFSMHKVLNLTELIPRSSSLLFSEELAEKGF